MSYENRIEVFLVSCMMIAHALSSVMNLESLDNPKNVKFKDLIRICSKFFGSPRIKGSHFIFKTPWQGDLRMNGIIPQGRALDQKQLERLLVRSRAAGYETILSLHSFGNEQVHCSHFVWESMYKRMEKLGAVNDL